MSTSYQGNHNDYRGSVFHGPFVNEQHLHLPRHEVDWPIRVGIIPEEAAHYQHRAVADHLAEQLNEFGTVALRQVLSGTGGVGKTQLAAHYARTLRNVTSPENRIDLLVWASASTRNQITYAYAQAARHLHTTIPEDLETAAQLFLTWLNDPTKHQNRRWLIIWDDLTDPVMLHDLWPPHDQPHGRMLVTTRRRDYTLTVQGRHLIDVDIYTPDEARAFFTHTLTAAGIPHTCEEIDALTRDLGHLPLALGQAVTYMAELSMSCEDYFEVFHNHMNSLAELFPDWTHPAPLAATWDLSLTRADTFHPEGVARPLMGLIALLDGTAIPEHILTAAPVLEYLTAHSTRPTGPLLAAGVSPHQARASLAALARLNLITRTTQQDATGPTLVGAHQLVQRATREHSATRPTQTSVHALADALVQVWPEIERDTALAQLLRANTTVLRSHTAVQGQTATDWLWTPTGHSVLFRAGRSLDEAGRTGEAATYWQHMNETARNCLGSDHTDTLITRHNLAQTRGQAGDAAGATNALEDLLTDQLRILGADHPHTLTTRANLARWRGGAGDAMGAATALEDLLTDIARVLGPDHPHTLTTRANLARWQGKAGDAAGAAAAYKDLLTDQLRVLGPDHPHTLTTRANLARWRGQAGDAAGAAAAYKDLLTDQLRVLGPDHPHTLTTRAGFAHWRGEIGDAAGAAAAYKDLLTDRLRILGPDHPHTLGTRANLARWQGQAGDPSGAATAYKDLLTDQLRILRADHPSTLTTRRSLSWWTYKAGHTAKAIELLTALVRDSTRVLGPNHLDTRTSKEVLRDWRSKLSEG